MTKTNGSEPNRLYQSLNLYSLLKTSTGKQLGNKKYKTIVLRHWIRGNKRHKSGKSCNCPRQLPESSSYKTWQGQRWEVMEAEG